MKIITKHSLSSNLQMNHWTRGIMRWSLGGCLCQLWTDFTRTKKLSTRHESGFFFWGVSLLCFRSYDSMFCNVFLTFGWCCQLWTDFTRTKKLSTRFLCLVSLFGFLCCASSVLFFSTISPSGFFVWLSLCFFVMLSTRQASFVWFSLPCFRSYASPFVLPVFCCFQTFG